MCDNVEAIFKPVENHRVILPQNGGDAETAEARWPQRKTNGGACKSTQISVHLRVLRSESEWPTTGDTEFTGLHQVLCVQKALFAGE